MAKRRGKNIKAKKPFQTVYIRKGEKRWGKRSVVAKEGMVISEASFRAARLKGFHLGGDDWNDRAPLEVAPTLQQLLEKHFGPTLPGPKDFILLGGMKLYYNPRRTEYRFVKESENCIMISIKYPNVAMASLSLKHIAFIETHTIRSASPSPAVGPTRE